MWIFIKNIRKFIKYNQNKNFIKLKVIVEIKQGNRYTI